MGPTEIVPLLVTIDEINMDLMTDEEVCWCQDAAMIEEWLYDDMRWYGDFMEFPEG